jgi:5-(carboxyamino)imidazole ribonucleotide mutase
MKKSPEISVIMGSKSDFKTMKFACDILDQFQLSYEIKVISAHRTPKRLFDFADNAKKNGVKIIIAGAGGAAHLPGMTAALTPIPVLGVPVESKTLKGLDSLLSIAQMPFGVPDPSLAITT